MEENGKKPAITIFYDAETQSVQVHRDEAQVKHWDACLMLLASAVRSAEFMDNMAKMQSMQQQAAQQQAAARIHGEIVGRSHLPPGRHF